MTVSREHSIRLQMAFAVFWGLVVAGFMLLPVGFAQDVQERLGFTLVFTVLIVSFHRGVIGGLITSLAASGVWILFLLDQEFDISAAFTYRVFIHIILLNALALLTSWLSERHRRADERYRRLFDHVPVGVFSSLASGKITDANDRLAEMLGRAKGQQLQGMDVRTLFADGDDGERWIAQLENGDEVGRYETRLRRSDGQIMWGRLTARISPHPSGVGRCYHVMVEDIGEAMAARAELEDQHLRTQAILESLPDATFVVDAEKRVIAWNRATEEMTGVSKDAVLGKGGRAYAVPFYGEPRPVLLDLIWQEHADTLESYDSIERVGETLVGEAYVPKLYGGQGAFVWAAASPLRDREGRLVGAIETVRDISRRKRMEQELEQIVEERTRDLAAKARDLEVANARLQELDELKSAFLNTVSHDVRTPLTSIIGFTKMVRRDYVRHVLPNFDGAPDIRNKVERVQSNLTIIESEGKRAVRLINDFLDLSKIEAGRMECNPRTVNVAECIREATATVSFEYKEKQSVGLVVDLPDDLPKMQLDPDRIVQVLVNLLTNALKFTDSGSVTISACPLADGFLQISIRDTGRGISLEEQGRIFDKFHQVERGDTMTTQYPRGTGLGLSICRHIIERCNGEIWVESALGEGSTFHVKLPPVCCPPAYPKN